MFYIIYKITNILDGKTYIGKHQTKNLDDGYMGSGKLLKRAINKHGVENFTKEILHVFDNEDEMNKKEKELVTESICEQPNTYNLIIGGKGGFNYINRTYWTKKKRQEHNDKISGLRNLSEEDRSKNGAKGGKASKGVHKQNFLGHFHTDETKQKMRQSKNNGHHNSQFGTCWICNENEVKKIPLEDLEIWIDRGYIKGRKFRVLI